MSEERVWDAEAIGQEWTNFRLDAVEAAPEQLLQVKYNGNEFVTPGRSFDLDTVNNRPIVSLPQDIDEDSYYTLVMLDLDSPKAFHSLFSPVKKWLIVNIKANESRGLTLAEYSSPSPYPFTGDHRYIFLLYKQEDRLKTSVSGPQRPWFYVRRWTMRRGMKLVAGNFFLSKKTLFENDAN